jgi:hypothetical protein
MQVVDADAGNHMDLSPLQGGARSPLPMKCASGACGLDLVRVPLVMSASPCIDVLALLISSRIPYSAESAVLVQVAWADLLQCCVSFVFAGHLVVHCLYLLCLYQLRCIRTAWHT